MNTAFLRPGPTSRPPNLRLPLQPPPLPPPSRPRSQSFPGFCPLPPLLPPLFDVGAFFAQDGVVLPALACPCLPVTVGPPVALPSHSRSLVLEAHGLPPSPPNAREIRTRGPSLLSPSPPPSPSHAPQPPDLGFFPIPARARLAHRGGARVQQHQTTFLSRPRPDLALCPSTSLVPSRPAGLPCNLFTTHTLDQRTAAERKERPTNGACF